MDRLQKALAIVAIIAVGALAFRALQPLRPARVFVVYGDTRTNPDIHREVVGRIADRDPKFVVNTGDLVADGSNSRLWATFTSIIGPIREGYYPVVGNHERWNRGGKGNFLNNFPEVPDEGYYDFERMGIHFVVVNQYVPYGRGSNQYSWFRSQIDDDDTSYTPTLVFMHEPHFRASEEHGGDPTTRDDLVPLMEREDVDAVFYGHSHTFGLRREGGITYVVAAGGGAPLYHPIKQNMVFSRAVHHFVLITKGKGGLGADVVAKSGAVIYEFDIGLAG